MTDNSAPEIKEAEHWQEAISEEIDSLQKRELFYLKFSQAISGARLQGKRIHARMIIWQYENSQYGLKHMRVVGKDTELRGLCEEVVALYHRELAGENLESREFQILHEKISKMWAVSGERERVKSMRIARKWSWIGGRKWAWLRTKSWAKIWAWAMAGTRQRNYSTMVALVLGWTGALKWGSVRTVQDALTALASYFLSTISKEE